MLLVVDFSFALPFGFYSRVKLNLPASGVQWWRNPEIVQALLCALQRGGADGRTRCT
jgi:hypothetical protein